MYLSKLLVLAMLLSSGGAHPSALNHSAGSAHLLVRRALNGNGDLVVTLEYHGSKPVCVSENSIRNPHSQAPVIELRHNGRQVQEMPPGYLLPVGEGRVILRAGDVRTFHLSFFDRFPEEIRRTIDKGKWQARVGIRLMPCDAVTFSDSWIISSGWTQVR
jgi:hypothetical protein